MLQTNGLECPWVAYIEDGQRHLEVQQADFTRPPSQTDRLYMNIGGSDVIEVGHPPMPDEVCHAIFFGDISIFIKTSEASLTDS